jgi:cytochrome c oxidase subunit 2
VGLVVALVLWLITVSSVLWIWSGARGMPAPLSDAARAVDAQLGLTLAVTGVVFVVAHAVLGWFVWRYRRRGAERARFVAGHGGVEVGSAVAIGAVFLTLAILGQRAWAALHLRGVEAGALVIEVVGEQFAWNVRYPGEDGAFGRTDPAAIEAGVNPLGLRADDPRGADDIVTLNQLAVPAGRPVELRLGSKDVLHSFFVPALRIKQDTVPGTWIPLRFRAMRTGSFEVPCAELCGLGHYRMKGTLLVLEPEAFATWLAEQKAAQ